MLAKQPVLPLTVHNIPASAFSLPRDRHTYDFFSVSSVVSDGFRLKTPLLNKCIRYLRGLKPTLRFLDRGATNALAIRGHVIPRHSAFFRGQKKHTYAKQPALPPRSQHSCLQFQPPRTPLLLRFLFRVLRGELWFPVANTFIEQSHSQLARAKAHATVFGPRNPRSRHSAFFRVFPRSSAAKKGSTRNPVRSCRLHCQSC